MYLNTRRSRTFPAALRIPLTESSFLGYKRACVSTFSRPIDVLKRLARSAGAGALATGVDLAVLTLLASVLGLGPRAASVPAFIAGGITMFFGQKYFAFRERGKAPSSQMALFAGVQLVGLGLNAALFEGVMRIAPNAQGAYVLVRLATTNIVWLAYSFPVWHLVFRTRNKPNQELLESGIVIDP